MTLGDLEDNMRQQVEKLVADIKDRDMTQNVNTTQQNGSTEQAAALAGAFTDTKSEYPCPCCGKPLTENPYKLFCACGFNSWKKAGQTQIPKEELDALFLGMKHKTNYLKIKKKDGGTFTARIVLDLPNRTTKFKFKKYVKYH